MQQINICKSDAVDRIILSEVECKEEDSLPSIIQQLSDINYYLGAAMALQHFGTMLDPVLDLSHLTSEDVKGALEILQKNCSKICVIVRARGLEYALHVGCSC